MSAPPVLWQVEVNDGLGDLRMHFHPGQWRAWQSEARFIFILAGTQSGKTSFLPLWMYREMQMRGAGDYLAVTSTFPLLKLKMLPEFLRLFQHTLGLGTWYASDRVFEFSADGAMRTYGTPEPSRLIFGSATHPESLESATAKAAALDEVGQDAFKLESWEAVLRRVALNQGRILSGTTIYNLGWLKTVIYDRWKAKQLPDTDIIQFDSTTNPAFPRAEFERAAASMPPWRLNMFYRGQFTRPAGQIYDSFDTERHTCPRFAIPETWERFMGLDFGGVHTAAIFYAAERDSEGKETGRLFVYREYQAGGRTAAEHSTHLLAGEPGQPFTVGGSKSEGQWRAEFRRGGLSVRPPDITAVEIGIDRVYGAHKRGEIVVFDDLTGYLNQKANYSRVLDDQGEPTEVIADKETYHFMDAERYIMGWLKRPSRA